MNIARTAGAALGLLLAAASVRADSITVTPAFPTPLDPIHVVGALDFPTRLCWTLVSSACATAAPDSILLTATLQYCNGAAGCICLAQPETKTFACDFPPLPAGTYKVVLRERHLNPLDPRGLDPTVITLTVAGPTPTQRRSWGRLKAIYR